jgi:hypothetical protein
MSTNSYLVLLILIECTKKFPHPIHVFMGGAHMHMTGQRAYIQVIRKGTGKVETIDSNNFYQHTMQRLTNLNVTIYPGDELITRCVYGNDNTVPVRTGSNTYNEMCMEFFGYYPRMDSNLWLCGYDSPAWMFCGDSSMASRIWLGAKELNGRKLLQKYPYDDEPRTWGKKRMPSTCPTSP